MNNEWITDRLPTAADCSGDVLGGKENVWVWRKSHCDSQSKAQVYTDPWHYVELNTPWAPIITLPPPAPLTNNREVMP